LSPSTIFGLPAYNGARHLAEALESLLSQTRDDLAIVVVDDCSSDHTPDIVQGYAALDPRIVYERSESRLGLVGNWNRVASLGRELFPDAPYFAWASDHDVWHPEWLESLAAELDAHPEAVLAYPLAVRMTETAVEIPARDDTFETAGISDPNERFRRSIRQTTWGYRIYGLTRSGALARCGPFPLVLLPDRLHLTRLALEGEFRQVPRRLWYRRVGSSASMSLRRQRRAFFPQGAPLSARLPWALAHARAIGGRLAPVYLGEAVRCELTASRRRWRRRRRTAVRRVRAEVKARLVPVTPGEGARVETTSVSDEERYAACLEALARAELLPAPGDVVLHVGGDGFAEHLRARFPETVQVGAAESSELPLRIDLAVAVNDAVELAADARRLHEHGVPFVYSFDAEAPEIGDTYWLRQVWVPPAPRPDPRNPAPPGGGHIVGRRRLVVGGGGTVAAVTRTEA